MCVFVRVCIYEQMHVCVGLGSLGGTSPCNIDAIVHTKLTKCRVKPSSSQTRPREGAYSSKEFDVQRQEKVDLLSCRDIKFEALMDMQYVINLYAAGGQLNPWDHCQKPPQLLTSLKGMHA